MDTYEYEYLEEKFSIEQGTTTDCNGRKFFRIYLEANCGMSSNTYQYTLKDAIEYAHKEIEGFFSLTNPEGGCEEQSYESNQRLSISAY